MKYLLDTNVCINYLKGLMPCIKDAIHSRHPSQLIICSVVRAEMFFGAMKSHYPSKCLVSQQKFLQQFPTLPFNDDAALIFATIRAHLQRQGRPIGPYDLQIAAIALANDLTLVTHNTREFNRVDGLRLTDWEI